MSQPHVEYHIGGDDGHEEEASLDPVDTVHASATLHQSSMNLDHQAEDNNHDPAVIYNILEETVEGEDLVWERIRRWLWAHPDPEQRRAAAYVRGNNDATILHLICKCNLPPADIVSAVTTAAPETASWADTHGWLPLHHACANGVAPDALELLIEAYPAGKLQPDQQNRTPLHFYATRPTNDTTSAIMATNAALLSDTGAAGMCDNGGMLPLHYATAYGTNPAVLQVLAEANPASLTATEKFGRTPMHLAMVNAHREASPAVLEFLLAHARPTINARDKDGYSPLHLMALGLKGNRAVDPEKRAYCAQCLQKYLEAEPHPAADFLTSIQDLPDSLRDTAVVTKHVRTILNEKIVKRFPTSILLLDALVLILLIFCFAFTTSNHIDMRLDGAENITKGLLALLFVGASYFLMRELVQIVSLASLGSLSNWFFDPANWLDMTVIVLVFYYGFVMALNPESVSHGSFRTGVTVTQGTLWVAIIVQLKSTLVDFAVFVGGLFNVVQRLLAFLYAVGVILLCFAEMFYFVYIQTDICDMNVTIPEATLPPDDRYFDPDLIGCSFPHCSFDHSLLKVYTMMMGEIGDETRYATNLTAQILYVGYAFLVVILLSNVLIAIVTDSYEFIQNDRAAIVFWSNRLDFIAEMDAIAYAVCQQSNRLPETPPEPAESSSRNRTMSQGSGGGGGLTLAAEEPVDHNSSPSSNDSNHPQGVDYFRDGWHQIMMLFDAGLYDDADWIETWVYNIFRIFCIFIVIPLWLVTGFFTAGWLWPPQVRVYLFEQRETVKSRSEMERRKLEKLKSIETDLKTLKQEMLREMATDRDDMMRMKSEVDAIQSEVLADLMQVKELLNSLLMS